MGKQIFQTFLPLLPALNNRTVFGVKRWIYIIWCSTCGRNIMCDVVLSVSFRFACSCFVHVIGTMCMLPRWCALQLGLNHSPPVWDSNSILGGGGSTFGRNSLQNWGPKGFCLQGGTGGGAAQSLGI